MKTKQCSICQQTKKVSEFYKSGKYWYPQCKECKRQKDKNTYHSNDKDKNRRLENDRRSRRIRNLRAKIFVYALLSKSKCIECGESRLETLDFDHVSGNKKANVSVMVRKGAPISSIKNEISKCEIRCANCHRVRTSKEFGWARSYWDEDDAFVEMNDLLSEPRKR